MFSTIAVAPEVIPVICLPSNLPVSPIELIHLNIVFDVNSPSDTLSICSLG